MLMKMRCSSLPLAFACPGSLRAEEGELRVVMAYEGGALGSAVHAALATLLTDPEDEIDPRVYAMQHGADADEVGRLIAYGTHAWRALREYFPNPIIEAGMQIVQTDFELTGHPDVLSLGPTWANFLDWKSGYKQADYFHQLMGYSCLIFETHPEVEEVRATVVWLREWTKDTTLVTRRDAEDWMVRFLNEVVYWNGVYSAGSHCSFCSRFTTCPARQALVKSAVSEIEAIEAEPNITDAVRLYREGKLSVMKRILSQVETMIRAHLEAAGPIDLGNGRELALAPEPRDKIDALKAWPVVSEALTNEELAPAIKILKTALLDAVADKAPRGRKAKDKTAMMEALKAAGAVATETIFRQVERKIEPKAVPTEPTP